MLKDTAGQERYRTITSKYYRHASGAIIVFGVQDSDSFKNTESWLNESVSHSSDSCVRFLCGNKSDLFDQRSVTTEEASAKAQDRKYSKTKDTHHLQITLNTSRLPQKLEIL